MAKTSHPIIALILVFYILVAIAVARRDIPNENLKKHDEVKHPDSFFQHDRGYLIPGIGRGIKPKCKDNPFTFNPVTGGILGGYHLPTFGSVGGGRRSYVPGGDDTFVPNPGFEVPNPGSGGTTPGPTRG